ncbi:MAG: hypothetical protein ABI824_02620 [Acidobacteriota bacterium]
MQDAIDEFISKRQKQEDAEHLEKQAALTKKTAIEENSPILWRHFEVELTRLVEKYNAAVPNRPLRLESKPNRIELSAGPPPALLIVVKCESPSLWIYWVNSAEFQIRIRANANGDVYLENASADSGYDSPEMLANNLMRMILG